MLTCWWALSSFLHVFWINEMFFFFCYRFSSPFKFNGVLLSSLEIENIILILFIQLVNCISLNIWSIFLSLLSKIIINGMEIDSNILCIRTEKFRYDVGVGKFWLNVWIEHTCVIGAKSLFNSFIFRRKCQNKPYRRSIEHIWC